MPVIWTLVDTGFSSQEAAKTYGGFLGIKRLRSCSWFIVIETHEEETKSALL